MRSAYCLGYQHWTVIPHHMEEAFADMVETGFEAVCFSFCESEMRYARRAFELQVNLAQKAGLKVFVVPSRLGGRFAGAPLMPSWWLASNPDVMVPGTEQWPVACIESPKFRAWIGGFMDTLLNDYPLDGIIWDEPKAIDQPSSHPDTVAKYGAPSTPGQAMEGYRDFLQELTDRCLAKNPDLIITLFAQKTDPEAFTRPAAGMKGLTYFGYDGNLARQSFFHEEPAWHKYRVESVWDRTVAECTAAGVQSFALVENMLMPAVAVPEFEVNFEAYLNGPLPDHLSVYYYAHNNEDPEAVQSVVRRLMKKRFA